MPSTPLTAMSWPDRPEIVVFGPTVTLTVAGAVPDAPAVIVTQSLPATADAVYEQSVPAPVRLTVALPPLAGTLIEGGEKVNWQVGAGCVMVAVVEPPNVNVAERAVELKAFVEALTSKLFVPMS